MNVFALMTIKMGHHFCQVFSSIDGAFSVQIKSYQRLLFKVGQILFENANKDIYLNYTVHLVALKWHYCLSVGEHFCQALV